KNARGVAASVAIPGDDHPSAGLDGQRGTILIVERGGVDQGTAPGKAGGVVVAVVNPAATAIRKRAGVSDDKSTRTAEGDCGVILAVGGGCIYQKFAAKGRASVIEASGVNSPQIAILTEAGPAQDIGAAGGHGCRRAALLSAQS